MGKTSTERQAAWRDRTMLKQQFFLDGEEERQRIIRDALRDDPRPEVRAVIEFFARYPRCRLAPRLIDLKNGVWCVYLQRTDTYEAAAAKLALAEVTSLPVIFDDPLVLSDTVLEQVKAEVAEMRRLNMWG